MFLFSACKQRKKEAKNDTDIFLSRIDNNMGNNTSNNNGNNNSSNNIVVTETMTITEETTTVIKEEESTIKEEASLSSILITEQQEEIKEEVNVEIKEEINTEMKEQINGTETNLMKINETVNNTDVNIVNNNLINEIVKIQDKQQQKPLIKTIIELDNLPLYKNNKKNSKKKKNVKKIKIDKTDIQEVTNFLIANEKTTTNNFKIYSPTVRALLNLYLKFEENNFEVEEIEMNSKITKLEEDYLTALKEKKHYLLQSNTDDNSLQNYNGSGIHQEEILKIQKTLQSQRIFYYNYYCKEELSFIQKYNSKNKKNDNNNEHKFYVIPPTFDFSYDYMDGEDLHFRLASSMFMRSFVNAGTYYGGANYKVDEVTYVCNPNLVERFEAKKRELAKRHGFLLDSMKPLVLFHGSRVEENFNNIMKTNFKLDIIGKNTGNLGYYGKGIYFSSIAQYSIGYSAGLNILLICLVFVGKAYPLESIQVGCARKEGYDSHTSTDGFSEVVIFDVDQILPLYKVKFSPG